MKRKTLPIGEQAQTETAVGMGEALGQSEVFLEFQERLSRVPASTARYF